VCCGVGSVEEGAHGVNSVRLMMCELALELLCSFALGPVLPGGLAISETPVGIDLVCVLRKRMAVSFCRSECVIH
jgi:hypothetical protein